MADITVFSNGESGSSVRAKINGIHDTITTITDVTYAQTVREDVIVGVFSIASQSITLLPISTPVIKSIRIFNSDLSTQTVDVIPNPADTINSGGTITLAIGTSVLLTPSGNNWSSSGTGGIASVSGGDDITVDVTDPANPIVNLDDAITVTTVNAVALTAAGSASDYLNEAGAYAALTPTLLTSSSTLFVSSEADLPGTAGTQITIANTHMVVIANITLTDDTRLLIGDNVTMEGVDRNSSSFTYNTTGTNVFMDFTTATPGQSLRISDMSFFHTGTGTGDFLEQEIGGSVCIFNNCEVRGSLTGAGNILLKAGQLFQMADGVTRGGCSIVVGTGDLTPSLGGGMDNMVFNQTNLIISEQNDERSIEFLDNSTVERLTLDTFAALVGLESTTGSTAFYFHKDATINILDHMGGGFRVFTPSSAYFTAENADAIGFGLLEGNTFVGAGNLYQCIPQTPDVGDQLTLADVQGLGFDGVNLLACDGNGMQLFRYTGTSGTPTTTITSPGTDPIDVDWYRGDLISLDQGDTIVSQHDGFTSSIDNSVTLSTLPSPITNPRGLTTDGTRIIIIDDVGVVSIFDADFFETSGPNLLETFTIASVATMSGLGYDGINLLVTSTSPTNEILVQKGLTLDTQYSFPAQGPLVAGVTITNGGYAESSLTDDLIYVISTSPTFDHSSPTWEVMTNTGDTIIESSDRGGSVFGATTGITVVMGALDTFQDLTAATLFYSDFTEREKCRMSDETNGQVTWTGVRDRARQLNATVTTTAANNTSFEAAIVIDGVVQDDSIGIEVFVSGTDTKTIRTMTISRDLIAGQIVKVQVRQTDGTLNNLSVVSVKLAIN